MYPEASEEILGEWVKMIDFDEDKIFSISESRTPIFEGGMDFLLTDIDKS
jgi:UDP-glucose 6-dehydrogenase